MWMTALTDLFHETLLSLRGNFRNHQLVLQVPQNMKLLHCNQNIDKKENAMPEGMYTL